MKNYIGIAPEQAILLTDKLNMLLSNYQIFYMNTRGFHWNITGEKFFELHLKFEEIYNNVILKIDEIAERILTLGGSPLHSFSSYLLHSEIPEITQVSAGKEAVQNLLEGFEVLIRIQREILQLSSAANDEATNALMSDYIREQEKLVWMFVAYLK
ncbi:MAG: Dps family protein [Bacteroidia bacterium]